MWGFAQQRSTGDDARTVPARVGSTGIAELQGLPDTIAGLAQGIVRLRDTYAPNVLLGYHLSVWGTGVDIGLTKPGDATVDALAARAAAFYSSLGASFDVAFAEFSDRDAGFKQAIYGDGGASWWGPADFARNVRFLGRFSTLTQKRIVMWQIPYGNTKMRAMNNTWNHYQDNRVEWLLDDPTRNNLGQYVQAGVIAFLFGRGADGATCACDGNGDGVTNPPAINGNTVLSLNADDDGGFFRLKASDYYNTGRSDAGTGAHADRYAHCDGVPNAFADSVPDRYAVSDGCEPGQREVDGLRERPFEPGQAWGRAASHGERPGFGNHQRAGRRRDFRRGRPPRAPVLRAQCEFHGRRGEAVRDGVDTADQCPPRHLYSEDWRLHERLVTERVLE
jgi:hypothetical protein